MSDCLRPHGLYPARLLSPRDFPAKNTGVGCHFLLLGILLIQGSNLCLLHCQAESYLVAQTREKIAIYKPKKDISEETNTADTLILDF